MNKKLLKWLASENTGASSETLAFAAYGIKKQLNRTPSDPSDFNRCLLLVKKVPEIKSKIHKVVEMYPKSKWGAVVENWDSLERCFIDEAGLNWCKSRRAPKTYKMMKDLGL